MESLIMMFMELWIGTAIWKVRCHYTVKVTMGKHHDPACPIIGWKTLARNSPSEKTLTNVCQGMYIKMIWQDCSYRWKTENFQMTICNGMDELWYASTTGRTYQLKQTIEPNVVTEITFKGSMQNSTSYKIMQTT